MKHAISLLLMTFIVMSCKHTSSSLIDENVKNWGTKNAQKIQSLDFTHNSDDLQLLDEITINASVVCIGESRHDLREQFLLKNRFVKHLMEQSDFKVFALEGCLSYSHHINNYIAHGSGNLDEIMADMPGWFIWDTEEMKVLFEWFYRFNQTQLDENKIQFFGIDIVAPNHALEQIYEFLARVDASYFSELQNKNFGREIIVDAHWPTTLQNYASLSDEELKELSHNYNELLNRIEKNAENYSDKASKEEFEWIQILAYASREANKMFSEKDRLKMGLIRDQAMATIALWIAERNKKLLIWAHNVHIAKSEFTMNMFPNHAIQGMGYLLHQSLGDSLISIGASFNTGEFEMEKRTFDPAPPNSIDGALASLEMDYFLLNLKTETNDASVKNWLKQRNTMRGQEFEMTCTPIKAYDAIFFTENISKVTYNSTTAERFRN